MSKLTKLVRKEFAWENKNIRRPIERAISSVIPHQHSAQTRATMAATREQMDFYKTQKDELKKESDRVNAEKEVERKRINEKQLRGLRRRHSASGFMGSGMDSTPETQTLG